MTSLFLLIGQTPDGAPQNPLVVFFPYIVILGIFYFLLIRPQQKRAAEHRAYVEQLKNGDKVITESGVYGTIASVGDDSVVLKVDDSVKIRILRAKVAGPQPVAEGKKKSPAKKG
jgi:preprotein translocase subunit YajC